MLERGAGLLVAAIVIAGILAGCGGGGSDSDASEGEGEPSKTFLIKGSENKIPKFGEEADGDERGDASEVLEENLEAREAGNWDEQCASLSAAATKGLAEEVAFEGGSNGCVKDLEALGEPKAETQGARENTMTGPIDALRVKGDRGWALYHGAQGKDWAMKMEIEDDEWKVGSLTTTELE